MLYSVNDISGNVNNINLEIMLTETDATTVKVQDLKLGFEYVFNISARSNHGSTSILCGPILYVKGKYTNLSLNQYKCYSYKALYFIIYTFFQHLVLYVEFQCLPMAS